MFKQLITLMFFTICLSSCENKINGLLNVKYNKYDILEDIKKADDFYFEKYNDEKNYIFDIKYTNSDLTDIKYNIAGICYCAIENKDKPHYCKDDEPNCMFLKNREPYIEYYFNDGNVATLIYKKEKEFDKSNLSFIESNGGNCYSYEMNVNGSNDDNSYILLDNNNNHICGLKLLNKNDQIKSELFNLILSAISFLVLLMPI